MSTGIMTMTNVRSGTLTKLAGYFELTKPKISVLVLAVVTVAFLIGNTRDSNLSLLLPTLIGTALVAASASASNQWLEIKQDRLMPRTRMRPLPSGVLSKNEVFVFGAITIIAGLAILFTQVNWVAAMWGVATWVMYVVIYTPLKMISTSNTAVGAVAGALPVFIGAAAAGSPIAFDTYGLRILILFFMIYLWQFPHFMAIAWIYKHDYSIGNMKMLTVVDPKGRRAGLLAVRTALAMIPMSLLPLIQSRNIMLMISCLTIGLLYLFFSIRFFQDPNDRSARRLLRNSLIYLPLWMMILLFTPIY